MYFGDYQRKEQVTPVFTPCISISSKFFKTLVPELQVKLMFLLAVLQQFHVFQVFIKFSFIFLMKIIFLIFDDQLHIYLVRTWYGKCFGSFQWK